LNRSFERARSLAERTGVAHADLQELPGLLAGADLVVSATGAAGHVVRAEDVRRAMAGRAGRSLVLLDLAVPRDAEPACAGVPGVTLFDIVSLRERAERSAPQAAGDVARAHEVVGEEVHRWDVRRRSDALTPLIRALQGRGDEAVSAELQRWSSRLASLTADEREAVVAIARGVAAKLLHDPIVELKERSGADAASHARLLAELFGIDPDDPA
jgi:glutamyl-tRNA reductase